MYNFIDSPTCPSCNNDNESTKHYLFVCQSHSIARQIMYRRFQDELGIDTQDQELLLKTILEGEATNVRNFNILLSIIYDYMKTTNRFT